jgi:hypothetical protein
VFASNGARNGRAHRVQSLRRSGGDELPKEPTALAQHTQADERAQGDFDVVAE